MRPMNFKFLTCILLTAFFVSSGFLAGCGKEDPEEKFKRSMEKADAAMKDSKWEEARINLLSALEAKSEDAEGHFKLAEVLLRLNKLRPAIEQYETALNLNPKHKEARLHLAAIKLAANRGETAESDVRKLMADYPDDPEVLILQASLERQRQHLDESRKYLSRVLEIDPDNATALASLGDVATAEGNSAEAEELLNRALKIQPKNSAIRLALADLFVRQNRIDEAQSVLESLVKDDPSNTSLRFYFGEFLLSRGLGERATGQYAEILKSDPKRHDARDRLYDMEVLRQNFDAARTLTAELKKIAENDPGLKYFLGRDAELDGKFDEALGHYLKAMELLPGFGPLFRHAGVIEFRLGKITEAVEHLNQAVGVNPNDVASRLALARHYFMTRDLARAKDQVTKILEAFPRQIGANVLKADIAVLEGDTSGAEKIYKALAQAVPDNPIGSLKLAALEEAKNNPTAAIEHYRKVVAFDRDVLMPAQRIGQLLVQTKGAQAAFAEVEKLQQESKNSKPEFDVVLGSILLMGKDRSPENLERARTFFSKAVEAKDSLLTAYFAIAQLDALKGDLSSSEANYKKLLEKQPRHLPSRMLLGLMYEQNKQWEKAAEQYREILSFSPGFAPAANNLAWLMAAELKGNLDEALKLALVAKEGMPNMSAVADTLGWIYFKRDSARAALPLLQEAVELEQKDAPSDSSGKKMINPEIILHLAIVQEALGMKEDAKQTLVKAVAAGADRLPNQALLTELKAKLAPPKN